MTEQRHCDHECVCGSYEMGMDDLEIQCQEPCRIAKCEHDTRSRPAPAPNEALIATTDEKIQAARDRAYKQGYQAAMTAQQHSTPTAQERDTQ